jgi:glutamate N-acetyltransferase/amino-acid N-acetyltransferase
LDLAVIISDRPASTAAMFTKNAFQAAPVTVSKAVLEKGKGLARGIVANSGCANAVTGTKGMEDARAMSDKLDSFLAESAASSGTGTLVMSTGVIGQLLPIQKVLSGITASTATLGSSYSAWSDAAKAFMTTDTFPKLRTKSFELGGKEVRMVGIDKGAGMIHPNMAPPSPPSGQLHATLLGMIATDAAITPASLQSALTYAVDRSFNSISVDGDMSTNDTIVVLANGASGAKTISEKDTPEEFTKFRDELTSFAAELAQLIVRDGEGATKFVKVTVSVRLVSFSIWKTVESHEAAGSTDVRRRTHHRLHSFDFFPRQDGSARPGRQLGSHPLRGGLLFPALLLHRPLSRLCLFHPYRSITRIETLDRRRTRAGR